MSQISEPSSMVSIRLYSTANIVDKIVELSLGMSPRRITGLWKTAGLCKATDDELESLLIMLNGLEVEQNELIQNESEMLRSLDDEKTSESDMEIVSSSVVQIAPQLPISSESSPIRKQRKISHFFVSKKSKKSDTKSGQSGEPRTKLPVKPISSTNFEPIDYSAPSNQSFYETVDVAHSSNFLGMLNECGIPPSYANDQEIEDREIELELETSRESLKSFTLLN